MIPPFWCPDRRPPGRRRVVLYDIFLLFFLCPVSVWGVWRATNWNFYNWTPVQNRTDTTNTPPTSSSSWILIRMRAVGRQRRRRPIQPVICSNSSPLSLPPGEQTIFLLNIQSLYWAAQFELRNSRDAILLATKRIVQQCFCPLLERLF